MATTHTPSELDAITPEGFIPPASPLMQFYIPVTSSLLERRPRTLKHGDTFGLFDHYGHIIPGIGSLEGLFHRDTRYLSDLRVFINGRYPLLLSSTIQDDNAVLTADLTNPDFIVEDELVLPRDTIHIVRSIFLWQGTCYERLGVRNFDINPQTIELSMRFGADFADIFELRGHQRDSRGEVHGSVEKSKVRFIYNGLDGVNRQTALHFDPIPDHLDQDSAHYRLELPPHGRTSVFFTASCEEGVPSKEPPHAFFSSLRKARRDLRNATARAASMTTSNAIFNEMQCRAMADLRMLMTQTEHGPYPYAGIPWYSTAFGRDAIITALQMLWLDPEVAKGVLAYLAATQAHKLDASADAEPGKILHETRAGELANLGEVPFARYYGSVDGTPLFIMLAGAYFERTGDRDTLERLWPHLEAALGWIDNHGDSDGDGFVEYAPATGTGLINQGWKDSVDSVFHADGSFAEGPIALCEVQGYVYAAKQAAAKIADELGHADKADKLRHEAKTLQDRFEKTFWCEEIGTYALALDGDKQQCKVRSSNAGQLLFCGIVPEDKAPLLAEQLLGQHFFNGWGIRTIAEGESRYNPMSYHNGSVWPHDNALIGLGLARYRLKKPVQRLFTGLFNAADYMDLRRLPELFCGFQRMPGKGPTFYPVACSPQAWACGTPFALLQAALGLELDCAAQKVYFHQPVLPAFLDQVRIEGLTLGSSRLDLLLRRTGTDVSVNVLSREGEAEVAVTL